MHLIDYSLSSWLMSAIGSPSPAFFPTSHLFNKYSKFQAFPSFLIIKPYVLKSLLSNLILCFQLIDKTNKFVPK